MFTLAELFAMSGFYLTMSTIQTGFSAAEESVKMLDGILGSNETSRALSSIITLVRQELTQDPRFSPAERGAIASLTALTKALTAFACLQSATHKRTLKEMRLRVVYDCTIVIEGQTELSQDYMNQISPEKKGLRRRSESNSSIMTDVRGAVESSESRRGSMSFSSQADDENEDGNVVTELVELIGGYRSSEEEEEDELSEDVRMALRKVQEGQGAAQFDYQISVEEVTTTTTTTVRTRESSNTSPMKSPARLPREWYATTSEGDLLMEGNASFEGGEIVQEDEWVEVSTRSDHEGDETMSEAGSELPSAYNGGDSVATLSRQDTIDHPEEGRQRLQVRPSLLSTTMRC